MMQDYPKALESNPALAAQVGFTMFPAWACFSPCKNNTEDAAMGARKGLPAGSAWSAESDQYFAPTEFLRRLGVDCTAGSDVAWKGVSACSGPKVVIRPSTALFFSEYINVFPQPGQVSLTPRSTLVTEGDIIFQQLHLNGSLEITAAPGTRIIVNASSVSNAGHTQRATDSWFALSPSKKRVSSGKASRVSTNEAFSEADLMRGFVIEESACERVSTEGMHGATIDAIGNEWAKGEELKDGKGVKEKAGQHVAVYYFNGVELIHSALYDDPSQKKGCFAHCCCARCLTCC